MTALGKGRCRLSFWEASRYHVFVCLQFTIPILFIFYFFVVYEVCDVMSILFLLSVINLVLTSILRHVCFCLKLWMMKGQIHEELNHLDNAREAYKQGVSKYEF